MLVFRHDIPVRFSDNTSVWVLKYDVLRRHEQGVLSAGRDKEHYTSTNRANPANCCSCGMVAFGHTGTGLRVTVLSRRYRMVTGL